MREKIFDLLEKKDDLPPLPGILLKLEKLINSPNSNNEIIAELIESEPVLTGRMITLANSSFLGSGREKVNNLPDVLMRLGSKMVLDLAYTLNMINLFMFMRCASFNQIQFWKHSFSVALLSDFLAEKLNLPRKVKEVSYVAGLMHDLGILVFLDLIPEEYSNFTQEVRDSSESLEVLEKEKLGITHSELGARFIRKKWTIDPEVQLAVGGHHQLESEGEVPTNLSQVVSLANRIANSSGLSSEITNFKAQLIGPWMIGLLGMTSGGFEELLENIREKVEEAESLLKGG